MENQSATISIPWNLQTMEKPGYFGTTLPDGQFDRTKISYDAA